MATTIADFAEMPFPKSVKAIRAGLPVTSFILVARALALTNDELAVKLGISPRTIREQKKKTGILSRNNSERLVRAARVHQLARKVFTSDEAVAHWLASPAPALDGLVPLELLDTDFGSREVEAVLRAIAYGNVM